MKGIIAALSRGSYCGKRSSPTVVVVVAVLDLCPSRPGCPQKFLRHFSGRLCQHRLFVLACYLQKVLDSKMPQSFAGKRAIFFPFENELDPAITFSAKS
ncbi:hypothetical protein ARMGADRAFT_43867 [Armillaria gallica]|uniref:Uncharacterized protein n=1 Tax=Armillaria gallica TaxID=47427 RepID=A0A2H3ENM7_ARMGA|nr:hypothetical protein ARMGADRAFT_43867 [Armillaria gallica]